MDTKRFFLYFIVIAALAMAGCGGNGGTSPMTGGGGGGGGQQPTTPTGPTVADLFETAQTERDNAEGAVMAATDAVKAAMEASGKLTADMVRGDSMMAQMNAQAVLDAQMTANDAVDTTETAVSNLMEAEDDAADHNNDALDSAIAAAMKVAERAVKDAMTQADSNTLRTAVQAVTGTDEDEPMTPADHAKSVAMGVGAALMGATGTDGSGLRVGFVTDITSGGTERPMGEDKYELNDHKGMTWAMIVGEANLKTMRIAAGAPAGSATRDVMAASFAGMPLTSIATSPPAAGDVADGTEFPTGTNAATYKGIPGTVFCAGSDCKVEGATGSEMLTGSWYFAPDDAKEWYMGTTTDGVTTYTAETQYARYGYWVARDATSGDVTVNVYAIPGAGTATTTTFGLGVNMAADATTLTDTSATYSGDAVGISLYKEVNPDNTIADGFPVTGEFMADVNLTANFGDAPTLGGRITNFRGNAVDSSWSVTLGQTAFTGGTIAESANAQAVGTATQGGIWTATAYGNSATARPQGIFGHFNTHFTNGHAAGAYATRKD